jgi:NTP pyrophosphatase (non-canonical NTP hydrolase)
MSNRIISSEQKIELARDAMRGAMDVRFQLGLGLEEPMCAFTTCETLGEGRMNESGLPVTCAVDISSVETFNSYQQHATLSAVFGDDPVLVISYLARIWRNSGELLEQINLENVDFDDDERKHIAESLGDVLWYVAGFATLFGIELNDIAERNAQKAQSMFMPEAERVPTPLHDEGFRSLEQFPRVFDVDFVSTDSETAVMLINGMRIGNPLRDNAYQSSAGGSQEIDGYRFHDCVHFALVATLGWSPVMRGLMKRKRKSNKSIDDAEDGARAQIVDEMIVKLTHSYAVSVDRARLLDGRARVGMDLLKQIESLADGLEVRKNRLWEWEKAILLGYATFGKLRRYGRGRIRIDLTNRSLQFSELQDGEGEQFPAPR